MMAQGIVKARCRSRRAGASVLYLPAYSPDLNPIEKMFSKLKAMLRQAKARTLDELWDEIGRIIETIAPQECRN